MSGQENWKGSMDIGQVRSQKRITEREEERWTTHLGHWFTKTLEDEKLRQNVHSTLTDQKGQELETAHDREGQTGRQQGYDNTPGPRLFEALERDSSWEGNRVKGIFIGVSVLLFPPFLNTVERVSMGLMGTLSYRTLGQVIAPQPYPQNHYFRQVWNRLRLIGLKKNVPVYLEFSCQPTETQRICMPI